jgi:hypothetical protein
MQPWHQLGIWQDVAAELKELRRQGLGRLLTEETVRFATVKALVASRVPPESLRYEWPHPALRGSRIDLVIGAPPAALIELKYPREPNEKNEAWTVTFGEVLKDFYRLATYPYDADRIFVYAESARLHKYMASSGARYGLDVHSETVVLHPDQARGAPATVIGILGPRLVTRTVTARRVASVEIDATLSLSVYAVDPLGPAATDTHPPAAAPPTASPVGASTASVPSFGNPRPSGARAEILAAIDAIVSRSGRPTFELNDVLVEMRQRNSGYAESTVRTMVTSHMCANAPDHLAKTFDDLERVGRGMYRRRQGPL